MKEFMMKGKDKPSDQACIVMERLDRLYELNNKVRAVLVKAKNAEKEVEALQVVVSQSLANETTLDETERFIIQASAIVMTSLVDIVESLELMVGFGSWADEDTDTALCHTGQKFLNTAREIGAITSAEPTEWDGLIVACVESVKSGVDSFAEYSLCIENQIDPLRTALDNYTVYAINSLNSLNME